MDAEELQLWQGMDRAVARRDLFWIFYYAHQLSTAWAVKQASKVIKY